MAVHGSLDGGGDSRRDRTARGSAERAAGGRRSDGCGAIRTAWTRVRVAHVRSEVGVAGTVSHRMRNGGEPSLRR